MSSRDAFDREFWEGHWTDRDREADRPPAHPVLQSELDGLVPGTALDAGCGEGAEAIWLAAHGWAVTGADIASTALDRARAHAATDQLDIEWVEADLGRWMPPRQYDLVTTFYAHPDIPQLEFYRRIAGWVRPGGTLLIVGHLRDEDGDHGHETGGPVAHATVGADDVVALLEADGWRIVTAAEHTRTLGDASGRPVRLDDVIVRATR
ncbi:MAG: class I SAM-dependent methyltransferase [Microbacteriaceae bacterium]